MKKTILAVVLGLVLSQGAAIGEEVRRDYYPSGELESETTYKNGELEGPVKSYYESGQLAGEGTIKDGKLEGPVKRYTKDGSLESVEIYKDGERISREEH